ncbi:glycosyltransferase [Microbacterium sp. No. 7]|uniref:glycosyltransferase n=1 Tax=Microbacterium sp. No. 7 TaxID=1714373 RepID=UPI0006D12422|nr:glycosyltransferase [Microbacterium sp. No. 7]ALJ18945.1 hypothetical protein AOA12_03090 [Microbacterium sp. No. 7]
MTRSRTAPRRIAFAADCLDVLGGVQRVVRELSDGLAQRGHDVTHLGLYPAPAPVPWAVRPDLVVHPADPGPMYSPTTPWRRAKLTVRGQRAGVRAFDEGSRRLVSWLRERPGSLVVATQLRSAEYLIRGGFPAERIVAQYHDAHHAAVTERDVDRLRRVSRRVARVLVLTEEDAAAFRADGVERVGHLRNPVDVSALDRLDLDRDARGAGASRERVVAMGVRLERQKAVDVAIRAWAEVAPAHPGWELRVYGDGSLRGELQRLIDRTGAPARLMGATGDFAGVLAAASVHVLSSAHEGMGLVIAEAMCAGTPTVTTDSGPGVRELVRPGETGLLVPVGDVPAFAAALHRLVGDAELRGGIARRAAAHVRAWERDAVVDEWEALLDGLDAPAASGTGRAERAVA